MEDALDPHERVTRRLAEAGPRRSADGVGTVILSHSGAVVVAVLLTFVLRALIDASYPLSLRTLGVQTVQAAPVALATFIVAAAALGAYGAGAGLVQFRDALVVAGVALALQQPYAAISGGTAKPLVMIPAQVVLLAAGVCVAERTMRAGGAQLRRGCGRVRR